MKPVYLAFLAAGMIALIPPAARAASSAGYERARACGKSDLKENETFDTWMGFVMDKNLLPSGASNDAVIQETKRLMRQSNDPCQKIVARLLDKDGVKFEFRAVADAGAGFSTEAAFSWKLNTILINANKPYMRNPKNLGTRFVHEYFHRLQPMLGFLHVDKDGMLLEDESEVHNYGHRARLLEYLNGQSINEGVCKLDEVPPPCRGIAPNMVNGALAPSLPPGRGNAPIRLTDDMIKALRDLPPGDFDKRAPGPNRR